MEKNQALSEWGHMNEVTVGRPTQPAQCSPVNKLRISEEKLHS